MYVGGGGGGGVGGGGGGGGGQTPAADGSVHIEMVPTAETGVPKLPMPTS